MEMVVPIIYIGHIVMSTLMLYHKASCNVLM
jgi:hypothetical protein